MSLLAHGVFAAVVAFQLSTHHAADHGQSTHDHAAALHVLWHGHSHETTTPDHGHPLLVGGTHALRVPTVAQPFLDAPSLWPDADFVIAVKHRVSPLGPLGVVGVGPPLCTESLSILRI